MNRYDYIIQQPIESPRIYSGQYWMKTRIHYAPSHIILLDKVSDRFWSYRTMAGPTIQHGHISEHDLKLSFELKTP